MLVNRPTRLGWASGSRVNGRAHSQLLDHSERLKEKFYKVGEHAWCLVGNGLSNQTFVEGQSIIAIDTGECHEEMKQAIEWLREETDLPIVACIYTHFHYVATTAIVEERGDDDFPIYGHAGIESNLDRFGGEVGPRGSRGMVHQFAMLLPETGPDGLVNIGLGRFIGTHHIRPSPQDICRDSNFQEQYRTQIAT